MLINLVICFWFLGFLFEIVILHPLAFFSEKLNCLKLFCLHCLTVHKTSALDFVIKFEFLCIYSLFSFQGTRFKKNLRKVLGGE